MKTYNSILVIDDDEIANIIHIQFLKKLNISNNIYVMKNGFEAIFYLKRLLNDESVLPELIIMDLNMRLMNGFEFLREFKKLNLPNSSIQVIVLTSSQKARDIVTLESLDIKYLIKPLTKEKFLACLE